ncbi:hypothetical protein AGR5A_Lc70324 [Agrobacterium genomosp. 5 str. CFBP 6626]|nr:hypothetical protein AGR5A_Lc70324 [Agrobacterium genomosp. 5 str. CFBP 6626]
MIERSFHGCTLTENRLSTIHGTPPRITAHWRRSRICRVRGLRQPLLFDDAAKSIRFSARPARLGVADSNIEWVTINPVLKRDHHSLEKIPSPRVDGSRKRRRQPTADLVHKTNMVEAVGFDVHLDLFHVVRQVRFQFKVCVLLIPGGHLLSKRAHLHVRAILVDHYASFDVLQ